MEKLSAKIIDMMEKYNIYLVEGKIAVKNNEASIEVKSAIEKYGRDCFIDMIKIHHLDGARKNWLDGIKEEKDLNNMIDDDCGRAEQRAKKEVAEIDKKIAAIEKKWG